MDVVVGLLWALPLVWAILIVVRLGEISRQLTKISDDTAALRRQAEDREVPH